MKTLFAVLALALPAAGLQGGGDIPDSVPDLIQALKERKDSAEVDLVKALANKRTREAMEGLLEIYPEMQSVYMRRAVCQGLALYDDVVGAEQPALEKLANVATEASERELREAAIELLGGCDDYGHAFLKIIVESSADDDIRERAMRHHVERARPEDKPWYESIFDPTADEKAARAAKKAKGDAAKVPHRLGKLRVLAFEALVEDMELEDLVEAASDRSRDVRRTALEYLDSRDEGAALKVAEDVWDRPLEWAPTRLLAAKLLLADRGTKFTGELIKEATKELSGREFSFLIADMLVELDDEGVNKKLLKKAGKGKGLELLFYLRATKHLDDPKLTKAIVKLLKNKEPEVQQVACELLGERREKDALDDLMGLVEKSEETIVVAEALAAITRIRTNDGDWEQKLVEYCEHADMDIRNGAVAALGVTQNPDYLEVLTKALDHEQWSTRLAAANAIETMRIEEGVGPICTRIGQESGRIAIEMSEVLFRLTGKPYGTNGKLWVRWWADEGNGFKIISGSKLRQLEREQEARRLKQISKTEFFGIRIESHRVTFILDVSGSMNEPTRGKYVGENGALRIEIAREELMKALDGLDLESLFNIVTFSSDVNSWRERVAEKTEATLEEAKGFVGRLGASGGTNLYGALEHVFLDPDVDTIYVMSDGEPTAGEVTDAMAIRERVAAWNENRGIVIHCIAVGGGLQVLEWIAEDTGGTYVKFP